MKDWPLNNLVILLADVCWLAVVRINLLKEKKYGLLYDFEREQPKCCSYHLLFKACEVLDALIFKSLKANVEGFLKFESEIVYLDCILNFFL